MYNFKSDWVIFPEDEQIAIANYCPASIKLNAREVVGFSNANFQGFTDLENRTLPNGADGRVGCTDIQLEELADVTKWRGLHDVCEFVSKQLYSNTTGATVDEKDKNYKNVSFKVRYINSDCDRYLILQKVKGESTVNLGLYNTVSPSNIWFFGYYNIIQGEYKRAWLVYDNKIRIVGKNNTFATTFLDGEITNYHIGMVFVNTSTGKYVYFQQTSKSATSNPAYKNFQIPDSALVKSGGGGGGGGGAGGPTSGTGGGGGNFDNTSSTISTPSGNIKGLVGSGMLGIFAPSEAQLKEFAAFLWSDNIFDQIKKYNDPLDMIISLTQIPTSPPIAGNGVVKIGNVLLSETFTLPYVTNQFFEFDMGEISIPEYWGNFLDYSPYTNIQIYLPYIGFREISTDDVMGGTIKLKYVIDCISGTCLGILEVVKKDFNAVLYQWTGNCSMEIPLTGRRTKVDFSSLFSILGTAAGGAAIGGAAGAAVSAGLGAVNAISQSATKPIISRSGNISSNGGFAGVQTPYIVISRKIQSLPDKYQVYDGYPSNISAKLSSLKGFVKVSKIHLDGIPCTESELDEINDYLTGGIII